MSPKPYGTGIAVCSYTVHYTPVQCLKDIFQAVVNYKDRRGYKPLHERPKRSKFKARNRRRY